MNSVFKKYQGCELTSIVCDAELFRDIPVFRWSMQTKMPVDKV